jgi:hypothetical protein
MSRAIKDLDHAAHAKSHNATYTLAHLAAVRAAGALISVKIPPEQAARMIRPASPWDLLPRIAPDLAEHAQFFKAGTALRTQAEHGKRNAVTAEQAEEMLSQALQFTETIEGML